MTMVYLSEDLGALRRVHHCCDVVFEHEPMSNDATDLLYGLCNVFIGAGLLAVQPHRGLKLDVQDVLVVAGEVGIAAAPRVCCSAGGSAPACHQRDA